MRVRVMKFYEYLAYINQSKESSLLHEISNKFNILVLSLEDIEELIEDTRENKKNLVDLEELETAFESINHKKKMFISFLNENKANVSSAKLGEISDLQEVVESCLNYHQKTLRDCPHKFILNNLPEQGDSKSTEMLIHHLVGLRAFLLMNSIELSLEDFNVDLSLKEEVFKEKERLTVSKLANGSFEKSYLDLIGSCQSYWLALNQ